MMVLWEKEEVNEKELVKCLYLKANTLTDLLKKLEQKGYVEICKDEKDRRQIIIKLTPKGRDLKKKAVHVPKTLAEEQWLTPEEAETFRTLLYKLLDGDWAK